VLVRYTCTVYPRLSIGTVRFKDGVLETDNPATQRMIQASMTYRRGIILAEPVRGAVEPPSPRVDGRRRNGKKGKPVAEPDPEPKPEPAPVDQKLETVEEPAPPEVVDAEDV
jgi:hypothetical protein